MAFVNEYISEDDKNRYQFINGANFSIRDCSQWTVDRARDMFLVFHEGYGPEGPQDEKFWVFYWHGNLLDVHVHNLDLHCDENDNMRARRRVVYIKILSPSYRPLTPELELKKSEIIADFKQALGVYGVAGLLIPYNTFQLELEVQ